MKPDGKIQGFDVWVREWKGFGDEGQWCIADGDPKESTAWVNRDGSFSGDPQKEAMLFPSREAALTHLRKLEEKERPVIDLSTAKFGDKFKRGDGKIETYACPREGFKGSHVMQSGQIYGDRGYWEGGPSIVAHLVATYTPPRTVWAQWCELDSTTWLDMHPTRESADSYIAASAKIKRLAIAQLTEGEGLAEPDVA